MKAARKTFGIAVALIVGTIGMPIFMHNAEANERQTEVVTIAPQHVFAPNGFDELDNSQLVVSGKLPNTCYKPRGANAQIDLEQRSITVKNEATFFSGCWCLFVLVPYTQTIDLGQLPSGTYTILVEKADGSRNAATELTIRNANHRDSREALYPTVDEVKILPSEKAGKRIVSLKGTLPDPASYIREVQVLTPTKDVLELVPLLERDPAVAVTGPEVPRSFAVDVDVNTPWQNNVLLTVRSHGGARIYRILETE